MTQRELFLRHVGQTSPAPMAIEVERASGSYLYDTSGKAYLDLIAGISVCNVGHCHPKVVEAISRQAQTYQHVMVYGELVESPQVQYARRLTELLPSSLNSVFFTASGSEACEGAMKLAKRATNRTDIACFNNSYHGSTQGALSVMGDEYWRNAFRPLLPGIRRLRYNHHEDLEQIDGSVAAVIAESVQAEAGVLRPVIEWITALRTRCTETGTLLVLDEIQCGFGRNGTLWAFEQYGIVPDILLLGKALGGGMPLGAFVADKALMDQLTDRPVLGHINTFGGHPVCCAAGLASLEVMQEEGLVKQVVEKEQLFLSGLRNPLIGRVNAAGLMIAVHFDSPELNRKLIHGLLERGVFSDWFLFAPQALRIAPPLSITPEEIRKACAIICEVLDTF